MSARTDVLLWAQRVVARRGAAAHELLELPADATVEAAQQAFHRVARFAHPDLHSTGLEADELELVTQAYARVAAAYQEIRTRRTTLRMQPLTRPPVATTGAIPTSPPAAKAVPVTEASSATHVPAMAPRALIHFRKAELCLRRGELVPAVLQLKMAIASDPQSAFLRRALAEVEAEVAKKP